MRLTTSSSHCFLENYKIQEFYKILCKLVGCQTKNTRSTRSAIVEGFPAFTDIQFGTGNQTFADLPYKAIQAIVRIGWASTKFALGDTRTDVGTDSVSRTIRIIDFDHYGTNELNVEQVDLEGKVQFDSGNYDNYSESDMRLTHLPALLLKYSSELQAVIGETNYKVATNGTDGTIIELTDKLFLGAEKEYQGTQGVSFQTEANELTQFALYANNIQSYRIKYYNDSAAEYYTRSPQSGSTTRYVCVIWKSGGTWTGYPSSQAACFAPIFTIK